MRVRCRGKESSRSLSHLLMSFLYVFAESLYTYTFYSFISFNDSLPRSYPYNSLGRCYTYYPYVSRSGVSTQNCTQGGNLMTVGRYVTILPNSPSTYTSVLSVCEVTVIGVRQHISADGKCNQQCNLLCITSSEGPQSYWTT